MFFKTIVILVKNLIKIQVFTFGKYLIQILEGKQFIPNIYKSTIKNEKKEIGAFLALENQ